MAEPQKLTITSSDQHRFDANLHTTDDPCAPLLVFLSAMGAPSRVYGRFSREMVKHGIQVCTPDWRGIGSSSMRSGRSCDYAYRHLVENDLPALLTALGQRFPATPIWLGGHSLGGQLSLLGAAANPAPVSGLVLIASGTVHLPCYSTKYRLWVRSLALISRFTAATLGYFPGSRIGFAGREASGVMRDWSHVALTGEYRLAGSAINYEQALRELKVPVLALNFRADLWSPLKATDALLKKLPRTSPVRWHWGKAETGGIDFDHFSWTKQPVVIAAAVARHIVQ
ncbi:MAG: alpha/beta fold hydrolase [Rhodoferax sp.]